MRPCRLAFEPLEPRLLLDVGPLVISELLAKNDTGIYSDWTTPARSDWIEIYNPTQDPVNLGGWYLTDNAGDLQKCRFPAVSIEPGGYLLVFASNNAPQASGSTMVPGTAGKLHTNFNLGAGGEYLALVQPDGVTVASSYAPQFPAQIGDVSYGWTTDLAMQGYFFAPTPGQPNGNEASTVAKPILINEIMYNTAQGEPGTTGFVAENTALEYLELYNKESAAINLTGWQLDRWWFAQEPIKAVPAGGVVRNGSIATVTLTGHGYANGDSVLITGATQPEYNGVFVISNVTANTFDYTVSGTPASPAGGTITAQRGVKRVSSIAVEDLVATVTLPSHGYANGDTILISGATLSEYNGVFTIGNVTQNTFDYTVAGMATGPATGTILAQKASTGLPGVTIPGKGYLVIAGDGKAFREKYSTVTNVVAAWTPRLSNAGEQVQLRTAAGDLIDSVEYSDQGDWGLRTRGEKLVGGITSSGTTATVNLPWHGYLSGNSIRIAGANETPYNGTFSIGNVTRDTFTYTMSGSASSPATGTITAQFIDHGHVGWDWYSGADGGGKSLELINPALSNNYGQNWGSSIPDGGTPGAANSIAAANIAPLILEVSQFPIIPRATETVNVTARIIDEQALGVTAAVYYRVDGAPTFTSVAMADDGLHGDGVAGDGVFGATLPAQANNTIIEFYVRAVDSGSRVRIWPAPAMVTGAQANLLYQVDNSYVSTTPWTPGAQPIYKLIMTEAERADLADIGAGGGDQDSDAMMNATFVVIDGTGVNVRYNAGVRNRGHGSRTGPPNNFHVAIPNDRPWNNLDAVNFNSRYVHAQALSAAVYQLAGLAVPDVPPVQLRVNNQNLAQSGSYMWYTYAGLESFNGDFLEKHFPDDPDGNLYTAFRVDSSGSRDADLRYEGTNPNTYRNRYFKANHEELDNWSDLIHMLDVLNNAPDGTYLQDVSQVINVEQWLRYLAIDSLIENYETTLNTGIGDDYFMYRGVSDPRFVLVPHDLDTTFGHGSAPINLSIFASVDGYPARDASSNGVEGLQRFLKHPDILPLYYQTFLDLLENVFNPTVLNPLIDQVLGPWVTDTGRIATIKQFVVDRANAVLAQIPQSFTITSTLPLDAGGYPYTTADNTSLSGTAPAAYTRSVLVGGEPAQWNAQSGAWNLTGSGSGTTTFTFQEGVNGYVGTSDTYLHGASANASTNYGGLTTMNVDGEDGGALVQGLIRFDNIFGSNPGQIPLDAQISSATLTINVTNTGNPVAFHRMSIPWDEMTATWNTFGGNGIQASDVEASSTVDATGDVSATGSRSINVTFSLQYWQSHPTERYGWALLMSSSNTNGTDFSTSEHGTSGNRPLLRVTTTSGVPMNGVPLGPGINRVVVQAFDGPDGTGNVVQQGYIDIRSDRNGVDPPAPLADPPGLTANPQLNLAVRNSYLPGVPILVRLEVTDPQGRIDRDLWDATVTLASSNPNVTLGSTQVDLYNGIGSALVTVTGTEDFTLTATLGSLGLVADNDLVSLQGQSMTTVSGTLPGSSTNWSGIIHVTADLIVPVGHTLTVQPGTLVLIDGVASGDTGVDIDVLGNVQSLGTVLAPVTFTAYNPALAWGEIHHASAPVSLYQYTEIMYAGHSPHAGHPDTGLGGMAFRVDNSRVTFDHSAITDLVGKTMHSSATSEVTFRHSLLARSYMGPELSGAQVLFENSFIQDMHHSSDGDGIYIHDQQPGQTIILRGGGIAVIDDDCIDTLGATATIDDMILRNSNDKGMSVYDGTVTVTRSLLADNSQAPEDGPGAIAAKGYAGSTVTVNLDRTTIVAPNIGIYAWNKYGVSNVVIRFFVTNSIIQAADPIKTDYVADDIHVHYSDIVGEDWTAGGSSHNINADPLFISAAAHDYRLQSGSPCIDSGDPAALPDLDGTRADMGYRSSGAYGVVAARTIPAGHITQNTILWGEAGPYHVTGDVIVDPGVTLTITPGTTIFFDAGAGLTINGRLVAEGTPLEQIRLTRYPGGGNWDGLHFLNTLEDNRVTYAILEYGEGYYAAGGDNALVAATNANLLLDHDFFDHATYRRIRTRNSSLIVRNSTFTNVLGPTDDPNANYHNNHSEQIWGDNAPAGGHLIIENNVFGTTRGHNDIIDVNGGHRDNGDPVPQIINNTFLGGGDEAMDVEGDFLIEGNTISHFHKDQWNTDSGESNAISAGDANNAGYEYMIARNVFYDVDHAVLIKDNSDLYFVNNTVVGATKAAVYFEVTGDSQGPGRSATVDGSIFSNCPIVFSQNLLPATPLTSALSVNYSVVPTQWHSRGVGNTAGDPRLADPAGGDFSLLPGSPALGTGPNGSDIGATVARWVSISGEPPAVTKQTQATLNIGGSGVTHYKYRVNAGAWSAETSVATPVELTALTDGAYTVYVVGKNFAGVWQDVSAPTASKSWTVNTSLRRVRINEVLAINNTAVEHYAMYPDMIELYNDGAAAIDLAGMGISDELDNPDKFVFASGTTIPAGGYLVLYADNDEDTPGIHLGFKLDGDSDEVYLFDTEANGRALLDSVEFGPQVPDLSIGRVGHEGNWALTQPTFGAANVAQRTGNPATLKLNEWFAMGELRLADDFVELYNPDPLPVPLAGLYLTDNPVNQPGKHQIGPLSFVAGGGCVAFQADGDPEKGRNHADFRLAADQEWLGLYDSTLGQIDRILHYHQTLDYSQGRSPDAAAYPYQFFALPTPGAVNAVPAAITALDSALGITEVMYNPAGSGDLEYLELQNTGTTSVDLGGVRLGGGIDFTFPAVLLAPSQYIVVVRDLGAFHEEYGPGLNVAGQYSGNLDNGGEEITLQLPEPFDAAILRFQYSNLWYPATDGGGRALLIRNPAGTRASWNDPASWQAGTVEGGSPGRADGAQVTAEVIINEVLTHTDPPLSDSVELHNVADHAVDVTGWYLSDSDNNLKKYRIPAERGLIPAGGYVVFTEADINPNPLNPGPNDFSFDGAHGDQVWLVAADGSGNLTRFVDYVEFGPGVNAESFGRHQNDEGRWFIYPDLHRTLGQRNTPPRVGPQLVISEIMYHHDPTSAADDLEYVEILNTSNSPVNLNHWQLATGTQPWTNPVFDFSTLPSGRRTIGAGQTLVVLRFDPWDPANNARWQAFRTAYGIAATEPVGFAGGYSGRLSNTGEKLQLQQPDEPPLGEPGYHPPLLHDEVSYQNTWGANATGSSLHRLSSLLWGDNAASWTVAAPSPGSVHLIVGEDVFYNNSAFDGRNSAATFQDGNAIATDKQPLRLGEQATFANYTSYSRGINGIIVDVFGLADPEEVTAADFRFRTGNDDYPLDEPGTWVDAPVPGVTVFAGAGLGGSDRVTIIWTDNTIQNQWLEVTVKATAQTGLLADDVFYFGNAIGESGNHSSGPSPDAVVDSADEDAARSNKTIASPAPITNLYDFNRDRRVNAADELIARNNYSGGNPLQLIDLGGGGHSGGGLILGVGLASAQATPSAGSESQIFNFQFSIFNFQLQIAEPLAHDAVLAAAAADGPAGLAGWDQRSAVPPGVSPALTSPWSSRWLWLLDIEPSVSRRPAAKRGWLNQTAVDEALAAYGQ